VTVAIAVAVARAGAVADAAAATSMTATARTRGMTPSCYTLRRRARQWMQRCQYTRGAPFDVTSQVPAHGL